MIVNNSPSKLSFSIPGPKPNQLLERIEHAILNKPSLDSLIQDIKCSQCGSNETYTVIRPSGIAYRQWYKTTDGQIVCRRCNHKDYHNSHNQKYQKRESRLRNKDRVVLRERNYNRNYYQRNKDRILLRQRNARLRQKIFQFPEAEAGGPKK